MQSLGRLRLLSHQSHCNHFASSPVNHHLSLMPLWDACSQLVAWEKFDHHQEYITASASIQLHSPGSTVIHRQEILFYKCLLSCEIICAFNRGLSCLRHMGESGVTGGGRGAPWQLWMLAGCTAPPNPSRGGPNDLFYTNTGALS